MISFFFSPHKLQHLNFRNVYFNLWENGKAWNISIISVYLLISFEFLFITGRKENVRCVPWRFSVTSRNGVPKAEESALSTNMFFVDVLYFNENFILDSAPILCFRAWKVCSKISLEKTALLYKRIRKGKEREGKV